MKNKFFPILLVAALTACDGSKAPEANYSERRTQMEQQGEVYLQKARTLLQAKNFDEARVWIDSLRQVCPLALNAREAGILLLDSLELASARDSLVEVDARLTGGALSDTETVACQRTYDELCQRVKFYQRKLKHDRDNRKEH